MAEMPRRQASLHPQMPFGALSRPPPRGRRALSGSAPVRATRGAASRRPMLPCESIIAHGTEPLDRWPREASEGPLWRGAGLPLGVSATGRRPALRRAPNCYDSADFLVLVDAST
eukprot:3914250-Alexandrium_andersonii.AAC.1